MAQWPTSPEPVAMKLSSLYPTLVSVGQSLKRQVRTRGGQRWAWSLSYRYLTRAQQSVFLGFALSLRGQFNTCTLVPAGYAPQGTWAGTPQVSGAGQVGRAVNLKLLTPGATGKAGDFLKFADTKVYILTADFTADGGGLAVANIEPALILSPANNEAAVSSSVPFTVALASDTVEFSERPIFSDWDCTLAEAY
jgi:hypothetical protein